MRGLNNKVKVIRKLILDFFEIAAKVFEIYTLRIANKILKNGF